MMSKNILILHAVRSFVPPDRICDWIANSIDILVISAQVHAIVVIQSDHSVNVSSAWTDQDT